MDFAALLTARPRGGDRFTGPGAPLGEGRTYGGLLAAQVLTAGAATAPGRPCHALHLLFAAAGVEGENCDLSVERVRDGAAFAQRRVELAQHGRRLVTALASFHGGNEGPEHGVTAPAAPDPDTLEDQRDTRARQAAADGAPPRRFVVEEYIDARPLALPLDRSRGAESRRLLWFRARAPLADDPVLHQAAIAFASDMGLVHVALMAHNELGDGAALQAASLDHALWFHRPTRADQWLLHVQRSPVSTSGRGMAHGDIFDTRGQLVASVAQEVLVRRRASAGPPAADGEARRCD